MNVNNLSLSHCAQNKRWAVASGSVTGGAVVVAVTTAALAVILVASPDLLAKCGGYYLVIGSTGGTLFLIAVSAPLWVRTFYASGRDDEGAVGTASLSQKSGQVVLESPPTTSNSSQESAVSGGDTSDSSDTEASKKSTSEAKLKEFKIITEHSEEEEEEDGDRSVKDSGKLPFDQDFSTIESLDPEIAKMGERGLIDFFGSDDYDLSQAYFYLHELAKRGYDFENKKVVAALNALSKTEAEDVLAVLCVTHLGALYDLLEGELYDKEVSFSEELFIYKALAKATDQLVNGEKEELVALLVPVLEACEELRHVSIPRSIVKSLEEALKCNLVFEKKSIVALIHALNQHPSAITLPLLETLCELLGENLPGFRYEEYFAYSTISAKGIDLFLEKYPPGALFCYPTIYMRELYRNVLLPFKDSEHQKAAVLVAYEQCRAGDGKRVTEGHMCLLYMEKREDHIHFLIDDGVGAFHDIRGEIQDQIMMLPRDERVISIMDVERQRDKTTCSIFALGDLYEIAKYEDGISHFDGFDSRSYSKSEIYINEATLGMCQFNQSLGSTKKQLENRGEMPISTMERAKKRAALEVARENFCWGWVGKRPFVKPVNMGAAWEKGLVMEVILNHVEEGRIWKPVKRK